MNIRRVKWSYLNVKKQKLEWRNEPKQDDTPKGYICNPIRSKEMEKLIKDVFGDDTMK